MKCFKDQSLVGRYAALVTWAGVDAVPWFRRQGFSEDQIVNSRCASHPLPNTWLAGRPAREFAHFFREN